MQRKTRVQHCSSCKNHGKNSVKRNHKCDYQDCKCILCELLQRSQKVMRHQQRVWRHQKLKLHADNSELEDPSKLLDQSGKAKCQVCDKCRNHNKLVPKRNHQCKYAQCCCVYCNLTSKRRDLMKYLQRVRRSGVISDANPEVRKARKFLEDNEAQFEFADDESGATDEDDVQEDAGMNVDDLELTQGEGQQQIVSEERVCPAEFPNQIIHHPKKQRLLNFCEGESDSLLLQESPEALSLDSPKSDHITFTGAKKLTSKRYGDELKMCPVDTSFQTLEVVNNLKQTAKFRSPINSSPPPLIQMPSRPSSAEGELTVTDVSYQRAEKIHIIQDHNSVPKRLSLESTSPSGYPVHIGRIDEEEPRMPPLTALNSTSLPRLQLPNSSTDMPLYIEPSPTTTMQGSLSPNHLHHLRLQYAALVMCQRSPTKFAIHQEDLQLRNSNFSYQAVTPSVRNYQNITQPVVQPLPLPTNASYPYSHMHPFGDNSQWNRSNLHVRPNFMSEDRPTGTSSLPRPLTDSSQRCYLLNPF